MENIKEKIRIFVEEECKKPTNSYGYQVYSNHLLPVINYAKILTKKMNANEEIVELAATLHDIGLIMHGRENHHITGAEIAEKKLKELNYPEEKIEQVKHCIRTHRGSKDIKRETKEAQIVADADAMSHFDRIGGIFWIAYFVEKLNQEEAREFVKTKLTKSFNKLSKNAKEIIKPRYEAAMMLLE
ncbi:metal-dependent phosphohydrolase [Candidatus Pacearchaeota archaeon CG10_big_fil_rev_8_21_14_0_10_35_13]|nr:MAG: metal-dependent phosphohydrolase [Candidatus Pacearchaeota archaeon CG10_big_fil_rev_8_21_14_0_10_35_13]